MAEQKAVTTNPEMKILDKIFELDAQYKGGIIKARDRRHFIKKYLCPLLREHWDHGYNSGYANGY